MEIALLSHRGGNIGHDFMAVGVEKIVRTAFGADCAVRHLEQHRPFEVYGDRHPLRLLNRYPQGYGTTVKRAVTWPPLARLLCATTDRDLAQIGLGLECGGPALHPGASRSPDMELMYVRMPQALAARGVPVANLSVGSAYPLERVPERVDDSRDAAYFRRMLGAVTRTTVRDAHAQALCATLGATLELVPCPSLGCGPVFERLAPPGESRRTVLLNVQARGANDDWGQGVDEEAWRLTLVELVRRLRARHELLFLAHDSREVDFALTIDATIPCVLPRTVVEYAAVLARAKGGLTSRIHAALPLASVGCSPIVVGTDTRLGTASAIGLNTFYVKEATADLLEAALEERLAQAREERERLRTVRESTEARYVALFRELAR